MSNTEATAGSHAAPGREAWRWESPLSEQPAAGSTQSVAFHLNTSGVSQQEESL